MTSVYVLEAQCATIVQFFCYVLFFANLYCFFLKRGKTIFSKGNNVKYMVCYFRKIHITWRQSCLKRNHYFWRRWILTFLSVLPCYDPWALSPLPS